MFVGKIVSGKQVFFVLEHFVTPKKEDGMELVLDRHIEKTEAIRGGKAHLAGTRITVRDVVVWHLHRGLALEEIAVKYENRMLVTHDIECWHRKKGRLVDVVVRYEQSDRCYAFRVDCLCSWRMDYQTIWRRT